MSTIFYSLVYNIIIMKQKYMENFSKNLKDLLGSTSLTEFSKAVGIPQPTLSRYLACQREITLEYLCKIADYFDEDLDVLLGRK